MKSLHLVLTPRPKNSTQFSSLGPGIYKLKFNAAQEDIYFVYRFSETEYLVSKLTDPETAWRKPSTSYVEVLEEFNARIQEA